MRCRTILLAAALALGPAAGAGRACDNPVYEYMYNNYRADLYDVLYFYQGEDQAGAAAAKAFGKIHDDPDVNLVFQTHDVSQAKQWPEGSLESRAWELHKDRELPFFVVVTPLGDELHVGPLMPDDVSAMISSPKRQELAKLLSSGKQGVLMLLEGNDEKANQEALKAIKEATADDVDDEDQPIDSGLMTLSRGDPAEKWLLRQAFSMRDDLATQSKPMLFAAFGHGFLLEPLVGDEIRTEYVGALIQFLNGPCTCDARQYMFGVYALTKFNWTEFYLSRDDGYGEPDVFMSVFDEEPLESAEDPEERGPEMAEPEVETELLTDTAVAAAAPTGQAAKRNLLWAFIAAAGVVVAAGIVIAFRRPADT